MFSLVLCLHNLLRYLKQLSKAVNITSTSPGIASYEPMNTGFLLIFQLNLPKWTAPKKDNNWQQKKQRVLQAWNRLHLWVSKGALSWRARVEVENPWEITMGRKVCFLLHFSPPKKIKHSCIGTDMSVSWMCHRRWTCNKMLIFPK